MTRAAAATAAIAAALLLAGCELDEDAGPVRTQERTVAAFDRIAVDGWTDVTVRQGSEHLLRLRGGERLLADVTTTVAGATLTIDRDRHLGGRLKATITLPRRRGVDADSADEIALLDIDADELELHHDGAGVLKAHGRTGALSATLGGVGELQLADLTAERADVWISGVGHTEVHVTGELDAVVTGVGDITPGAAPATVVLGGNARSYAHWMRRTGVDIVELYVRHDQEKGTVTTPSSGSRSSAGSTLHPSASSTPGRPRPAPGAARPRAHRLSRRDQAAAARVHDRRRRQGPRRPGRDPPAQPGRRRHQAAPHACVPDEDETPTTAVGVRGRLLITRCADRARQQR